MAKMHKICFLVTGPFEIFLSKLLNTVLTYHKTLDKCWISVAKV